MKYKVHVQLNSPEMITKAHGLDKNGRVTKHLRDTVERFCDPYIPFASSSLKTNKRHPDNSSIQYVSPYAHYMYYGELMLAKNGSSWARKGEKKHYTGKPLKYQGAPKRGPRWEQRMMNDRGNDVVKDLQKFIDGG